MLRATFRLTGSYNSPRRLVNLGRHHSKPVKPVPAPIANRDWSAGQPNSSPFGILKNPCLSEREHSLNWVEVAFLTRLSDSFFVHDGAL
ncbi:hypothetical protein MJO29_010238 [Puccinia striiformis f. sp. tritici]|nr:hypothetical protein MJO29_010238 [Puccinia striiformis f. sp. tritici]